MSTDPETKNGSMKEEKEVRTGTPACPADERSVRERFMRQAVELACRSVEQGGGPFGAVIVRDGEVVATGSNKVVPACDPTAHAEVTAIRAAAQALGTYDLSGCEIYTSCEPCPMCLGAIYWARIDRMYYGCDQRDAARAGFDDSFIYREIVLDPAQRRLASCRLLAPEAREAFRLWEMKPDKTEY